MTAEQELASQLLHHQKHFHSGKRDEDCSWCIYAATLDHDEAFLKKIPAGIRLALLAPIKKIGGRQTK